MMDYQKALQDYDSAIANYRLFHYCNLNAIYGASCSEEIEVSRSIVLGRLNELHQDVIDKKKNLENYQ